MTKFNLTGNASIFPEQTFENISATFRWNILFISLAALLIIYFCIGSIHRVFPVQSIHTDFVVVYDAARAVAFGTDLYQSGHGGYIYPPFFACLLWPLAHLTFPYAFVVWLGINLILLTVILVAGFRALSSAFQFTPGFWQALGICSLAIILSYDQVRENLVRGECDAVTLAGIALGFFWLDRRPSLAGVLLGIIVLIKYQSLFFLPFLLLRGRWRVALAMIAGIIAASLLPAILVGWKLNLEYLDIAVRGLLRLDPSSSFIHTAHMPDITWGRNVSITNGVMRSFLDHGLSGKDAWIMVMTIAFLTFLLLWWMFQHFKIPLLWRSPKALGSPQKESAIIYIEWAAILISVLVFSPQSAARHQFLIINVKLLASMMLLFPTPNLKRWPLVITLILMQLILPGLRDFPQFHLDYIGGPGWALWLFLIVMVWNGLAYYRDKFGGLVKPHSFKASNNQVSK